MIGSLYSIASKRRLLVLATISWSVLLGGSRYFLQAHYVSDVFAGFAYGYLFLVGWVNLYIVVTQRTIMTPFDKSTHT
ncbi:hypothetical protein N781_14925 [Pontibacillus halophilus JSM 076056 = DSM 19796]|uniref:Phosphatidic acid phosphatase type 2/haloperoxidase domain-containing protein n=1 Tax=Pontibacillus halophilus JSM 076056 = DSM 19796 TaxID=1385510 RepID=A0A0A5GHN5_9BACI|nr:hypothetical protein N781_14925 [Pontibacillus halophilus JSM 076056 = DSM 19796]